MTKLTAAKTVQQTVTEFLNSSAFTHITCDKINARRIMNRLMSKHWWFVHSYCEGEHTFIVSSAIDPEREIRAKLKGVDFHVEE